MRDDDRRHDTTETVSPLQALGLTPLQLQALARQGFVARESRGASGQYFKLRFRTGGKQVVRGLGRDPDFASEVEMAVYELQKPRCRELEMSKVIAEAASMLRAAKNALREPLAEQGIHFHGQAIRRTRVKRSIANPRTSVHRAATS